MPIYTRTGDKGKTSLFGGTRISKADARVEAYGSIDELTSYIGIIIALIKDRKDKKLLIQIQKDLYEMMAYLAGAKVDIVLIEPRIKLFEQYIDIATSRLPKLNRFILPQGTPATAHFHVCRTIARKTERRVVGYLSRHSLKRDEVALKYLNRLSDLLFTLARKYNKGKEVVT